MMWNSPRSTPVIMRKCCSDNRSPRHVCYGFQRIKNPRHTFDPAEMGVIAHLYRGEVYRSTIWRTRLDNTTNWAIVTMGIALSTTFCSPEASPLPLVLVGLLLAVFLGMEARRYRYFNVWRARARWLEKNFYAPIFTGEARDDSWQVIFGTRLHGAAPPHFVCPRGGAAVASQLRLDFRHPGNCLLRQDSHPSDACGDPGRIFPIAPPLVRFPAGSF